MPAHSYKFASALQSAQKGASPILIRIQTKAGHGIGKPTEILIQERADILAFLTEVLQIPYTTQAAPHVPDASG
jgi:prolyl oligopeptidase